MIILITVLLYYLVLTSFDFRNFITEVLPSYDFSFIGNDGIILIVLSIGTIIITAVSLIYDYLYFGNSDKMTLYRHVGEFTKQRRKQLRLYALEMLFASLLHGFFVYLLFKDYFIASFKYAFEFFSGQSLIPFLLGLGLASLLILAVFLFVAIRTFMFFGKSMAAFSGTTRLDTDFCERCSTGCNNLIVLSESTSSSSTNVDSLNRYGYVETDVSYNSSSDKIDISSTPKSLYSKKETTTTTSKSYYTCRCCAHTDVKTSVDVKKKDYYLNDRGKWRES